MTLSFQNEEGRIITHRIVEITNKGRDKFLSQRDANRSEDEGVVSPSNILGKVIYVIPKLGVSLGLLKITSGLIMLIAIQALALII